MNGGNFFFGKGECLARGILQPQRVVLQTIEYAGEFLDAVTGMIQTDDDGKALEHLKVLRTRQLAVNAGRADLQTIGAVDGVGVVQKIAESS